MTGSTPLHRRPSPRVAASLLTAVALVCLSACGGPESLPAATVTVWVDPPADAAADPGADSTPEPATTTTTEPTVPLAIRAGHQRGAVSSYEQASEHFDRARRSVELASFRSPSGNIYCRLGPDFAACEVREGRVEPPVDGICTENQADDIGRLELVAGEASPVCNTDSIRDPKAPKLAYGRIARVTGLDVTCLSEEWGVTCVDPRSEHGFFVARGSFTTF